MKNQKTNALAIIIALAFGALSTAALAKDSGSHSESHSNGTHSESHDSGSRSESHSSDSRSGSSSNSSGSSDSGSKHSESSHSESNISSSSRTESERSNNSKIETNDPARAKGTDDSIRRTGAKDDNKPDTQDSASNDDLLKKGNAVQASK